MICFMLTPKSEASNTTEVGIVDTDGANLNVRSKPSTSSSIITRVKDDSYLTILSQSNNFYYARVSNNVYGYVSTSYVDKVSSRDAITLANLNIRTGASTASPIITTLTNGESLKILSSSTYWSKVVCRGSTVGYAYNNYLKTINASSINLPVTNYKQFDSRWKNEEIVSGQTIGQIGCLTTSFSICESYRLGYQITPSDMRKRLNYTSSGDAFWPKNYYVTTSSSYLSIALTQLKNNKPVIIGARKNNAYHFVVIKGYNGKGLNPSNFTISDPGSSYRTTLADFFSSYPTFYKLAYYTY